MKKLWGCILVFAVLLTGCRSASVLSFDVWRPAKVTFPADIVRVTVVNNSAEPNEKEGNKYKDISGKEYTLVVPHDSTTYRLAEYIALELSDAHYFPEITIFYDDSITLPKSLYPLLSENQLSIVRGGADNTAVVSLDNRYGSKYGGSHFVRFFRRDSLCYRLIGSHDFEFTCILAEQDRTFFRNGYGYVILAIFRVYAR